MPEPPGACPGAQRLREHHSGLLTYEGTRRVAAHAADCAECSAELEELSLDDGYAAELRSRLPEGGGDAAGRCGDHEPSDAELHRLLQECAGGGRYELIGELGSGGMGVVYAVRDRLLQRDLAMKVVRGSSSASTAEAPPTRRGLARFLREARITGRLQHPSIIPVHELGVDDDGRTYFTMPRVDGQDLHAVFADFERGEGDWTLPRLVALILRACDALAFAHSRGVVHRDLKPANIMIGRFGAVYVMDWGIAKDAGSDAEGAHATGTADPAMRQGATAADEAQGRDDDTGSPVMTLAGEILGTPAYMAPEQARGRPGHVDARSDVYSMGAIFYRLLSRRRPFDGESAAADPYTTWSRLLERPPDPLARIAASSPPELVAICERAMARDPASRYADMEGLAADLRAWLDGRVVSAHESGTWAETKKWLQRNKPLAGSLAGVILAMATGLAASLAFKARSDRNAELVTVERNEARRGRADVLRLSAFQKLRELKDDADGLWPVRPDRIDDYRAWLDRARELVAGLEPNAANDDPGHREQLRRLRARAVLAPAGALATVDGPLTFPSQEDRWWHAQLETLVAEIEAFADEGTGLVTGHSPVHGAGVARRLEVSEDLRDRYAAGGELARRWARDLPRIHAVYPGLVLPVQVGIVPIGPDPDSGLWEFWHLATGEEPRRDARGRLELTERSGVVLVLVPGGTFWMGAQSDDPAGRHYHARASPDEAPVRSVSVSPYFLSKYELTQGQWSRSTQSNPSKYQGIPIAPTLLHPVEQLSWLDCHLWLPRMGLTLPSEAQWEFAARAGTETSWWTGPDRESLVHLHAANLADRAAARGGNTWPAIDDWPTLDDGAEVHAEVGTFAANGFGLHDVHGNVFEWCLDGYGDYLAEPGEDPVRAWNGTAYRVLRGGSFNYTAHNSRSAARSSSAPSNPSPIFGVRPGRAIAE